MEKLPSGEDRTKFFQNSANLAKTLAFWVTSASFVIGYLIVWKYLASNGELWLFPKVVSDYPFQLFMFGFVMVFLTFLMPFFFGIISGILTADHKTKEKPYLSYIFMFILYSWCIYVAIFKLLPDYKSYIPAIFFYMAIFLFYMMVKNGQFLDISKALFIRTLFLFFSFLTFLLTLPSSKISTFELPEYKIIVSIILLFSIVLIANFLGINYVKLIKSQLKDGPEFLLPKLASIHCDSTTNHENNEGNFCLTSKKFNIERFSFDRNIKIKDYVIIFLSGVFIIILLVSNFFDIPRIIIFGIGMGGRYYGFTLQDKNKKNYFPKNLNNVKLCVFIQTKSAFYITKVHKGKSFCDMNSSAVPLGSLERLPKKAVISVTPE